MKVLIADDEFQIRTGLQGCIDWGKFGFDEVHISSNGLEALALFREHRCELVITDIRMPGLDGLALTEEIRRISPDTLIIILSGHAEFDYAQRALKLGVTDYLVKPVKLKEFVRLIETVREKKQPPSETEPVTADGSRHSAGMLKALEYIRKNLGGDLSVEEVAEHIQKTPNYFSHLFKKEVGISFSEYLNRSRIDEAKKLMKTTNLLAYEISEKIGYRDYRYFVEVFKKLEGCPPSEYRNS